MLKVLAVRRPETATVDKNSQPIQINCARAWPDKQTAKSQGFHTKRGRLQCGRRRYPPRYLDGVRRCPSLQFGSEKKLCGVVR